MIIWLLIAFFALSLLLIVALFALKAVETERNVVYAAVWRDLADEKAHKLKILVADALSLCTRLPAFLWLLTRFGVHVSALFAARLARATEEKAHQLADYVSHKRGFERREVRSEFLKRVSEYKNGNGGEVKSNV